MQRWDGTTWSISYSRNRDFTPLFGANELSGVACRGAVLLRRAHQWSGPDPAALVESYSDKVGAPTYTVTS